MTSALPYLAALANAFVLGIIALLLRSLGRVAEAEVVDLRAEPKYRLSALQQTSGAPIVLRLEDLEVAVPEPAPVMERLDATVTAIGRPAKRHHHH